MLDYRPDLQPSSPGLLTIARNVVPDEAGNYITSYAAQTSNYSGTIIGTGAIVGARMFQTPTASRLFVGAPTKLFEANGAGGWTDRSSTTYGLTSGQRWAFTPFGDQVIAASLGAPTQVATATGSFADLSGAPKAVVPLVVSGHLLLANYNDGSASPSGVKWASQASSTDWTATNSNTAGNAILRESPGAIVAGAEIHDIAVIWKKRSMYVGRKVGGAGTEIFQFNLLSPKIGIVGQEAWASTPVGIIFVSGNGVFRFDGSVPEPIDRGIRKAIYVSLGTPSTVEVSHDEKRNNIIIWVPGGTVAWTYNYKSDKWSQGYASTANLGTVGISGFVTHVRDSNYEDASALATGIALGEPAHYVIATGNRLVRLSGRTPANSFASVLNTGLLRDPNAAPDAWTIIKRAVPLWATEDSTPLEATSGGVTATPWSRISGAGTLTTVTGSYDTTAKRFDVLVAGNTIQLAFSFTDVYMGINDIAYEFGTKGKR